MTTNLAQLINLTLSYNSNNLPASDIFYDNHDFKFFMSFPDKEGDNFSLIADSPEQWLSHLKTNRCQKLYLNYSGSENSNDGYKTAAFANGGNRWIIAAKYEYRFEYWTSYWKAKNKENNKTIWDVHFYLTIIGKDSKSTVITTPVYEQKTKLSDVLIKISEFAKRHQYAKYFVKDFQKALKILNDNNPQNDYFSYLIPQSSLEVENQQLLLSAVNAIVFGGSGSWNDVGLEKNITYRTLSALLNKTINDSIEVAVNN